MATFTLKVFLSMALLLSSASLTTSFTSASTPQQNTEVEGAWQLAETSGPAQKVMVVRTMQDGFFSVAHFNLTEKKFLGTYGGSYTIDGDKVSARYEFNTFDSSKVGSPILSTLTRKNGKLMLQTLSGENDTPQTWVKVQEKNPHSPLAGAWRISARAGNDGNMNPMKLGPRRTIKILSGDRFQWIAFNLETAAFSGTGGGTYTLKDGKYTEHIQFFSRDNNRVGMDLTFNYAVKDGNWHHTGLSSTGGKVNEVWTRLSK